MSWRDRIFRAFGVGRPTRPGPETGNDDRPPGDSLEDWQPGDLAECIVDQDWWFIPGGLIPAPEFIPARGEIRLVKDVVFRGATFLAFSKYRPSLHRADGFRKVKLDPERQFRREAEFVPVELIAPGRAPQPVPADKEREDA